MADNHFAALRACGWSREDARKILRDAKKGDTWAKADISRALADRKPANEDGLDFWRGAMNGAALSIYLWAIIIGVSVSWMN